jgi:hypothetical protein
MVAEKCRPFPQQLAEQNWLMISQKLQTSFKNKKLITLYVTFDKINSIVWGQPFKNTI